MNQPLFESTFQEDLFQLGRRPVVVINESWEILGENERELLTKIISALKISIDSVTIVTQPTLDIASLKQKADRLIYFGILPAGVSRYEVLESDQLSFICSECLSDLLDNEPARKQLWMALKKLFSV